MISRELPYEAQREETEGTGFSIANLTQPATKTSSLIKFVLYSLEQQEYIKERTYDILPVYCNRGFSKATFSSTGGIAASIISIYQSKSTVPTLDSLILKKFLFNSF